jgi:hypothetical protein
VDNIPNEQIHYYLESNHLYSNTNYQNFEFYSVNDYKPSLPMNHPTCPAAENAIWQCLIRERDPGSGVFPRFKPKPRASRVSFTQHVSTPTAEISCSLSNEISCLMQADFVGLGIAHSLANRAVKSLSCVTIPCWDSELVE